MDHGLCLKRSGMDRGLHLRFLLFVIFSVYAPLYVIDPQLWSTCHCMLNHYVKIWHVAYGGRGGANNVNAVS